MPSGHGILCGRNGRHAIPWGGNELTIGSASSLMSGYPLTWKNEKESSITEKYQIHIPVSAPILCTII